MTRPNNRVFLVDQLNGTFLPGGPADWLRAPDLKALAAAFLDSDGWRDDGPFVVGYCARVLDFLAEALSQPRFGI